MSNDDGLFVAGWGGSDDELEALACGSPHVFIDAPRFSRTIPAAAGQTVTLVMVDHALPPEFDVALARLLSS